MVTVDGIYAESKPVKGARPLRTAFAVVYGTLLLLVLAAPGSVASWLDDLPYPAVARPAAEVMRAVETAANKLGIPGVFSTARATFHQWVVKDAD